METSGPGTTIEATVFIVVSVKLYREGLALALGQASGLDVAGSAAELTEFGDRFGETVCSAVNPVLLLDIDTVAGPGGLTGVRAAYPTMRVLALGLSGGTAEIVEWIEAGAAGYVTRQHSVGDLATAIRALVHDEVSCSPRVTAALVRRLATLASDHRRAWAGDLLSRRELEVVMLIDRGLSNKQIAAQLFIAVATVKNHVHNILDKLEVRGRDEAAAYVRGRLAGDLDLLRTPDR